MLRNIKKLGDQDVKAFCSCLTVHLTARNFDQNNGYSELHVVQTTLKKSYYQKSFYNYVLLVDNNASKVNPDFWGNQGLLVAPNFKRMKNFPTKYFLHSFGTHSPVCAQIIPRKYPGSGYVKVLYHLQKCSMQPDSFLPHQVLKLHTFARGYENY